MARYVTRPSDTFNSFSDKCLEAVLVPAKVINVALADGNEHN